MGAERMRQSTCEVTSPNRKPEKKKKTRGVGGGRNLGQKKINRRHPRTMLKHDRKGSNMAWTKRIQGEG